ncbi:hypothetical protein AB0J38_41075 [Streptomyces sp. NPDC050095]|uniref:hypothetical protein n=1 Tax=unclassified Streptomyces TaxID=2593676 RepID=UPI00342FB499
MHIPFLSRWRASRKVQEQVTELLALNRRRELLVVAAQDLAQTFDDSLLALHLAPGFSDHQIHVLTELFWAAGHREAADKWQKYAVPDDEDMDPFAKPASA